MNPSINIFEYVLRCLRARRVPQKVVAKSSGVPFSTVAKIAQGAVADPSVNTVQKLYQYFAAHPDFQDVTERDEHCEVY